MAFLAAGLLAELGVAVAEGVGVAAEAVGISSTTASTIGGAVGATAVSKAGSAINSAVETGVDAVFGQGTAEKYENEANRIYEDSKQVGNALNSGNYDQLFGTNKVRSNSNVNNKIGPVQPKQPKPLISQAPVQTQKDPVQAGKDLGQLVVLHLNEIQRNTKFGLDGSLTLGNPTDALNAVIATNPALAYLAQVINTPTQSQNVYSSPGYKQIASVYNGKSITDKSVSERTLPTGLKQFAAYDEVGALQVYNEDPNGIKIPTLHGYWVGPKSRNDHLPIDLFDTYAYYHDVDYHNGGWFDLQGDYKFISRLSQNIERFPISILAKVKMTIIYFSTIGNSLARFKNWSKTLTGPGIMPNQQMPVGTETRTIYDDLAQTGIVEVGPDTSDTFHAAIVDGLKEETDKSSMFGSTGSALEFNKFMELQQAVNDFDNLSVQIL
jgi:hypothetical protein